LPVGFTAKDLFCILDADGRGKVDKGEFVQGMFDLTCGSSFHRECRAAVVHSRFRQSMKHMEEQMRAGMQNFQQQVMVQLEQLQAHQNGGNIGVSSETSSQTHGCIIAEISELQDEAACTSHDSRSPEVPTILSDGSSVRVAMPTIEVERTRLSKHLDDAINLIVQARCELTAARCVESERIVEALHDKPVNHDDEIFACGHAVPLEARLRPNFMQSGASTCSTHNQTSRTPSPNSTPSNWNGVLSAPGSPEPVPDRTGISDRIGLLT